VKLLMQRLKVLPHTIVIVFHLFFGNIVFAETGEMPKLSNVLAGELLYREFCLLCHKEKGIGEPKIPEGIRLPGYYTAMPLNETSHAWHHSDEQLFEIILKGLKRTERMPAFENILSHKDAYDLVAYIKSLWSPRIVSCQGKNHMRCMSH